MSKEPSVKEDRDRGNEAMQFEILCVNGSAGKYSVFKTTISCEEGKYSIPNKSLPDLPKLHSKPQGHCLVKQDKLVYCIGGECNETFTTKSSVFSLDLSKENLEWKERKTMKEGRRYFGAALYDGKLVVNGGQTNADQHDLNTTEQFHENNWNELDAKTNVPRAYHALVAAEPASGTNQVWSLFAIGGLTKRRDLPTDEANSDKANGNSASEIPTKSVERLGNLDGQWEKMENMNTARGRFAAVFCAGFIYAIGGCSPNGETDKPTNHSSKDKTTKWIKENTVEKYDISKNTWTEVASMKIGRMGHAACVVKDKIFVFGGRNNDNKIEKTIEFYDPEHNKWMNCGKLEHKCMSHAAVGL